MYLTVKTKCLLTQASVYMNIKMFNEYEVYSFTKLLTGPPSIALHLFIF